MPKTAHVPIDSETRPDQRLPAGPRLGGLREEIERLFDAFEPGWWRDRPFALLPTVADLLSPAMGLAENDKGYVLRMEVPGIAPDGIVVRLANAVLSVSGEKSEEKTEESEDVHLSERRWGRFRRAIRLPGDVDADAIDATCANGVLTIRLPKTAEAMASGKTIGNKAA